LYRPESFREEDRERLLAFIEDYAFATLVTWGAGEPEVSHVPVLVRKQAEGAPRLLGHVARANEHWRRFDGRETTLAIFHGPHGYISPSWYATHPSVPTWNYAVVHAYGKPVATHDAKRTGGIVRGLVRRNERPRIDPWDGEMPSDYFEEELRHIVGFEMPIERLEGKFKLSQNRAAEDRAGVLEGLRRGGPAAVELAEFMDRRLREGS
jgi:transcriptional regulator